MVVVVAPVAVAAAELGLVMVVPSSAASSLPS